MNRGAMNHVSYPAGDPSDNWNWKDTSTLMPAHEYARESRWYRITSLVREDCARLPGGLTPSLEDCELMNALTACRGTSGEVRFHRLVSLAALVLDALEQEELRANKTSGFGGDAFDTANPSSRRAESPESAPSNPVIVGDESIHGMNSEVNP